jgi:hypothetical protein
LCSRAAGPSLGPTEHKPGAPTGQGHFTSVRWPRGQGKAASALDLRPRRGLLPRPMLATRAMRRFRLSGHGNAPRTPATAYLSELCSEVPHGNKVHASRRRFLSKGHCSGGGLRSVVRERSSLSSRADKNCSRRGPGTPTAQDRTTPRLQPTPLRQGRQEEI